MQKKFHDFQNLTHYGRKFTEKKRKRIDSNSILPPVTLLKSEEKYNSVYNMRNFHEIVMNIKRLVRRVEFFLIKLKI